MKIDGAPQKVVGAYLKQSQGTNLKKGAKTENNHIDENLEDISKVKNQGINDKVELSNRSKAMQQLNEALERPQGERQERIMEIKRQVDAGTYNVAPENVAAAMMTDLIKDLG